MWLGPLARRIVQAAADTALVGTGEADTADPTRESSDWSGFHSVGTPNIQPFMKVCCKEGSAVWVSEWQSC